MKIVAPSSNYQCAQNPLKERRGTAMRRTDVSSWKSLCPHNIVEEFKIGGREAAANEDCKRPEGMSSIEKVCQDKEGDPEEAVLRARLPAVPSRTWGSRKIRGISSERQSECALFLSCEYMASFALTVPWLLPYSLLFSDFESSFRSVIVFICIS